MTERHDGEKLWKRVNADVEGGAKELRLTHDEHDLLMTECRVRALGEVHWQAEAEARALGEVHWQAEAEAPAISLLPRCVGAFRHVPVLVEDEHESQARYLEAAGGVQAGTKMIHEYKGDSIQSLRTGSNLLFAETSMMVKILIEKGLVTEAEFRSRLADCAERERDRLATEIEDHLEKTTGNRPTITLHGSGRFG